MSRQNKSQTTLEGVAHLAMTLGSDLSASTSKPTNPWNQPPPSAMKFWLFSCACFVAILLLAPASGSDTAQVQGAGSTNAPQPLPLIDLAAPDASKLLQFSKGTCEGSVFTVDKGGISVEFAPWRKGNMDHPGIFVHPAQGKFWDLSGYGHIEAKITNTGDVAGYLFSMALVDEGWNYQQCTHKVELVALQPGESTTLKLFFGYEMNYKPGLPVKTDKIESVYFALWVGCHKNTFRSFRIEDLKAAGPAGEKPAPEMLGKQTVATDRRTTPYVPTDEQLKKQWLKWKALWEVPAPQGKTPEASATPAPQGKTPEPSAITVQQLPVDSVDLGNGVKLDLVQIPVGEYMMGSPDSDKGAGGDVNVKPQLDEHPQHRVRITKPFYLGKYPVTQEQWEAVMGSNPSLVKSPKNPVEQVSWEDCQKFLDKLNAKLGPGGGKFQLPTEAQWEYACRAGSTTKYYFGDDEKKLGDYAWYLENSDGTEHPVGGKKPNAWGLYDMHGNVWEWCLDWYPDRSNYYKVSAVDDPPGPPGGSLAVGAIDHVYRGGSWYDPAEYCRSAFRYYFIPYFHCPFVGFRVARVPADDAAPKTGPN